MNARPPKRGPLAAAVRLAHPTWSPRQVQVRVAQMRTFRCATEAQLEVELRRPTRERREHEPNELRQALERFGVSQADLARQANVTRRTVVRWLAGDRRIPWQIHTLVLRALKRDAWSGRPLRTH
jgi:DNA-binding transcriptional regulator YiaG